MTSENVRKVTKFIVSHVVGYGTGVIVYGIIKNNVAPDRTHQKIGVATASFVLGDLVSSKTLDRSNELVDKAFDAFDRFRKNNTES